MSAKLKLVKRESFDAHQTIHASLVSNRSIGIKRFLLHYNQIVRCRPDDSLFTINENSVHCKSFEFL